MDGRSKKEGGKEAATQNDITSKRTLLFATIPRHNCFLSPLSPGITNNKPLAITANNREAP